MTSFRDIARAYDSYANFRSWGPVNRGLIYTCNAGWIDLGHMSTESDRFNIGASNLWSQVSRDGPLALREVCKLENGDLNFGYTVAKQWLYGCFSDPYFRFDNGSGGYVVHYRQDHAEITGRPGAGGHYVVRKNLNEGQKKSVALSIYMDVTHRFENFQRLWGLGDFVTDSGYSQDDLVSNLLGFYIAIGDVSKTEAIRLAHPVSRETAEAIWNRDGPVGQNKNFDFEPDIRNTAIPDHGAQMTLNECIGQPQSLPEQFRRVRPVEPDTTYVKISNASLISPF